MKNIYYVLGAVLVLVGLVGFVNNPVLGMFEVNALHNIVHIVSGVLLLWAAMKDMGMMSLMGKVLGVVYLLVTILGFAMNGDILGLMMVNMADNVLHLALAAVLLYFGFAGNKPAMPMQTM